MEGKKLGAFISPEQAGLYARNNEQFLKLAASNGYLLPEGRTRLITR